MTSGARVRNAYRTYPVQGDSPWKRGLIPRGDKNWHRFLFKAFGRYGMAMRLIS